MVWLYLGVQRPLPVPVAAAARHDHGNLCLCEANLISESDTLMTLSSIRLSCPSAAVRSAKLQLASSVVFLSKFNIRFNVIYNAFK